MTRPTRLSLQYLLPVLLLLGACARPPLRAPSAGASPERASSALPVLAETETSAPAAPSSTVPTGRFELVDEFKTPGLETELSGIYPHLTDDNLYYVVTNGKPQYPPGMKPLLPVELRNKLLTVDRQGRVVNALDLPDGGGLFGDLAFGDGYLWLGPLDPPALWKLDLQTGQVVARFPLPGPAGGLDFDPKSSLIYVQSYIGHPHLALVDSRTGVIVRSLWSDENCQGVAMVNGDLLTVWTSSWEADAYTELWQLDTETGKPVSRVRMEGIHAGMAPLNPKVSGFEGFMTLVHTGSGVTGETVIRRFRYVSSRGRPSTATLAPRVDTFAAIPFLSASGELARNREQLEALVTEAAQRGTRFIALPELSVSGALGPSAPQRAVAEPIPGPTTEAFGALARKLGVWLVLSLPEQDVSPGKYHITTVLLDDHGQVAARTHKRLLRHNGEDGTAQAGFARLLADSVDARGRRIGILSGDDLQAGVARLAERGADVVLVSANWAPDDPVRWNEVAATLARQYRVSLVIANRHPGLGGIFSRTGEPLQRSEAGGPSVLLAPLEVPRDAWRVRSSLGLPPVPVPMHLPFGPGVVDLGRALFFDKKLSSSGEVACASCHKPEHFFSDGQSRGTGVHARETSRNVPSLLNAAFRTTLHWDGNPTTLEQQVKYPLTGYAEMNARSYDELLAYVRSRQDYVSAFRLYLGVEPGELTREHLAQALAAFERTLVSGNSPFDRYFYGGQVEALSASAKRGLALFTGRAGCSRCHLIGETNALFMDSRFHRLGVGYAPEHRSYKDGGVGIVSNSDYSGMFFTPSLRNVAETAPYLHDGSASTLEEAIQAHFTSKDPAAALRDVDPALRPQDMTDLVAFLRSLTGAERYSAQGIRLGPANTFEDP